MCYLKVAGGRKISGDITVSGAKNAALPIMAASLLTDKDIFLKRVPDISDVWIMADILRSLGAHVEFDGKGEMLINAANVNRTDPSYDLVGKMNASFDITGPLLSRFGEAQVPLPGGCNLGSRPVNMHIDAFRELGAEVVYEHGYVKAWGANLYGTRIPLQKVSVGTTKNAMMAAVFAEGTTVIENAALEPEVTDLANFLNSIGAKISGHGTGIITIEGVKQLSGGEYEIIPDRILTGLYLTAAAITGGNITVQKTRPDFLETFITKLLAAGQTIKQGNDFISLISDKIRPVQVTSAPYPGFPTDLQPIITALMTVASGTSVVVETIFDRRYMYVDELRRLGADLSVSDRTCIIRGVPKMTGAPVKAPDIRGGGALILAALAAEGESIITGLEYIDRGHEKIENALASLGADIRRVNGSWN